MKQLSDDELKAQTEKFRNYQCTDRPTKSLCKKLFMKLMQPSGKLQSVLGMRHFDVQIIEHGPLITKLQR